MESYLVWIFTDRRAKEDSDLSLYLTFCGTKGKTGELGPYTNFKAGEKKTIEFSVPESLGDITLLKIKLVKEPTSTHLSWEGQYIHVVPLPDYHDHPGWIFTLGRTFRADNGWYMTSFPRVPNLAKKEKEEDIPKSVCEQ
ncbi:hypothetical protein [Priestia aryabhattai]|uniref:hypothetical protein n=1 Tax=Priestia aryabhattai TaxID=412384 RepID=UPI003D2947B4